MAANTAETRPSARRLAPLAALAPFVRPHRGLILLALVALAVAAGASLLLPVAARQVIDHGFSSSDSSHIGRYFLGLLAVTVVMGLAAASRYYLVTWIGERVVADVRNKVFSHVLSLSAEFFERVRTGELLSRLTADTTLVQTVVGSSASFALRSIVMALGAFVMMAVTSPKLTAIALLSVPLVLLAIILMGRRVRGLSRAAQDRIAETSALASEVLNAIPTVQAYTHEPTDRRQFSDATELAFASGIRRTRFRALMTAAVFVLVGASIVGVLWIGAIDVLAGRMSAGQLGQFLLYAVLLASSVGALSELWGEVQRAAGATERLMEILATEPRIVAPEHAQRLPSPVRGQLEFSRVRFAYPTRPEHAALEDFSLHVAPGEAVALVGPSGAGKSTVFQLLLRFFDPGTGRILLDGVDIARLDPAQLRAQIAVVAQEPVIFAGSIADNIRYGRPTAGDDELRAAAVAAAADEFVRRLPQGYDTRVGERGITLSGGQRQRLAIARAMLRDAPVLLLDEATSALDAENERLVQQGLANLMAGREGRTRTTLVIAHRLATIQRLRRIVVMDHGRIVAQGSHAELIRGEGLYARLAALQFQPVT
ncbi:MAG TPA: ABC transporter transmembrane domain-containing protein [Steroidobacteraceae bacterium]|nr:ABC transporter transmembrane domain-containing protein [Steroidobacteraceae bacterium]